MRTDFPRIPIASNNLALLGDIGHPDKKNYEEFLQYTSLNFERVFLIAGNHEYWNSGPNTNKIISEITSKFNNIEFLNNSQTHLDQYSILGTTLWSNAKIHKTHFDQSLLWLEKEITLSNEPTIVLTHHLPSFKLIVPQYWTKEYAYVRDRYASNLDYLMTDKIKVWLCGHSHCTIEMKINNTLCCINTLLGPKYSCKKSEKDITRVINLTERFILLYNIISR
ncbi:MAG: metallophosphoesterase [Nitrososphaeraceae archaeon]|nr:metallophosphoesterase [Nitrososphaeraceae archaeon]